MTLVFSPPKLTFDDKHPLKVLSGDVTDFKWGKIPSTRTIEELLKYGIINLDKPPNPTSHEVVSYVKRILGIPKAGHSGTLDPQVTGVLPTALGKATRILDTLLLAGKEYVGNMRIHADVDEQKIRSIVGDYVGELYQRPPLRASVKRVLRKRTIYNSEILDINEREVLFRISSQAGFYVRKYCLHPDTHILTSEGSIPIVDFVEDPKPILSFNDGRAKQRESSAVQTIPSPSSLVKLTTKTGISIIVTPDHEMLKSTTAGYKMIEARDLETGDFLVKSLRINLTSEKLIVADLLDDEYLIEQEDLKEKCKNAFIEKYGSIREMSRKLNIDRQPFISTSSYSIKLKHLKLAGIYEEVKNQIYRFKQVKGQVLELKELTDSMLYLLGLIASDGNNSKEKGTVRHTRLIFNNTNKVLIDKFVEIYRSLFPHSHYNVFQDKNGVWGVSLTNSLLATIASSLGISSPKKDADFSPLLKLEPNLIRSYMRGYFDGDGSVQIKNYPKNVKSRISLYTVNENEVKILHKLLLKLEIENSIFKRVVDFKGYNTTLYFVSVGKIHAELKFIKEIGSNHPDKILKFNEFKELNSDFMYGDGYYMGLHYTNYLIPHKTELRKTVGGNLNRVLDENIPITRSLYKKASNQVDLPDVDDFIIEEIVSIEDVPGTDYVYDMTVPETHNFLIETGFVSSNCHDIGQSLGCGAHMKELRRTRSGPFSEYDYLSTLQNLYDAYAWYKEEKDENPLRNIILPMEYGVKHIPKILIKDSAVDPICHGAPLALPGVSKYSEGFKAGDMVAIYTLKNELIALGEAQIDALTLPEKDSGIVTSIKRVLMHIGTYPSSPKK